MNKLFLILLVSLVLMSCEKTKVIMPSEIEQVEVEQIENKELFEAAIDISDEAITSLLQHEKWGPDYGFAGVTLVFEKDMNVKASTNFEGGYNLDATYIVEDGIISLIINQEEIKYTPPQVIKFKIMNGDSSLLYNQCLVSIEGSKYTRVYWNLSSRSEIELLNIDTYEIEIDRGEAAITQSTRFFKKPHDNSDCYMIYDYENNTSSMNMTPALLSVFNKIVVIGVQKIDPEWILVFKPIHAGSYYEMKIDNDVTNENYCWVKREEISF